MVAADRRFHRPYNRDTGKLNILNSPEVRFGKQAVRLDGNERTSILDSMTPIFGKTSSTLASALNRGLLTNFQPHPVIYGVMQLLFATQVSLGCLNRCVPEEELDLF